MPIDVEFVDNGTGVIWTVEGAVRGDDFRAALRQLLSDRAAFSRLRWQIVDYTNASRQAYSTAIVQAIAELDVNSARINPNLIVAIVVQEDLDYGMVRMWQAYVSEIDWRTHVWRSRAEADSWIRDVLDQSEQ